MTIQDAIDDFGLTLEDADCWTGTVQFAGHDATITITNFDRWRAYCCASCEVSDICDEYDESMSISFDDWLYRIERDIEANNPSPFSNDI